MFALYSSLWNVPRTPEGVCSDVTAQYSTAAVVVFSLAACSIQCCGLSSKYSMARVHVVGVN